LKHQIWRHQHAETVGDRGDYSAASLKREQADAYAAAACRGDRGDNAATSFKL
jgi:hypothetical protein